VKYVGWLLASCSEVKLEKINLLSSRIPSFSYFCFKPDVQSACIPLFILWMWGSFSTCDCRVMGVE
jgi:hypothetical protein